MANGQISNFPRWLGLILALGLTLRIIEGTTGIWMDEAWSVLFAQTARDPVGVFFRLNHDNNHHLNTLWLQIVGVSAPPLIMRAPVIICSTIAIAVAARFARRDGDATALATALLFAVSPFFILYGSEARGYGLVTLAILLLLAETRDWLESEHSRRGVMATIVVLGCFSHLVMLPALVLVAGWAWLARGGFGTPIRAAREVGNALDGALIVGFGCGAFLIGGAQALGGMAVGADMPFDMNAVLQGPAEMAGLTLGLGSFGWSDALILGVTAIVAFGLAASGPLPEPAQRWLWLALIVAMPFAVMVFQADNSQIGRYYILGAIGLLLLIGNRLGVLLAQGGGARKAALGAALTLLGLFGFRDALLIDAGRGVPQRPVEIMQARSPQGASILVSQLRSSASLEVAAAQRRYPLRVTGPDCKKAHYLHRPYADRSTIGKLYIHCGASWRLLARFDALPASLEYWALYAREDLPSQGGIANRLPPSR